MRGTMIVLLCLGFFAGSARAVDRHVPSVYPTIQSAINAAFNGDAVIVQPGTYPESLHTLGKDIDITGAAGGSVTITGGIGILPVLTVGSGGGTPEVSNVTIRDNDAVRGGGIYVLVGARATFRDCKVWQNTATDGGGGVFIEQDAYVTMENCDLRSNHSDGEGGGIYTLEGVTLQINDTLLESNTATLSGGAIRAFDTGVEVSGSTQFLGNASDRAGGAIIAMNGTILDMDSARFFGNQAGWDGGALELVNAGMSSSNCVFECNSAVDAGGAVFMLGSSEAFSRFDRFIGNSGNYAGAVGVQDSSFEANVSLFRNNTAADNGGGLYVSGLGANATASVYNSVFEGNFAARGAGAYILSGPDTAAGITRVLLANTEVVNNTLVGDFSRGAVGSFQSGTSHALSETLVVNSTVTGNSGGAHNGVYAGAGSRVTVASSIVWANAGSGLGGDWTGGSVTHSIFPEAADFAGTGNLNADPLFRDPGTGDFALVSTSPAIDSGNSALVPADAVDDDADSNFFEPLPLDLAGYDRFVNDPLTPDTGVDAGLGVVDIGAHEFRRTCTADFAEPITVINFDDVLAFLTAFGAMQPIADLAPAFGAFDFGDVLAFLTAFGQGCPD